MGRHGVQVVSNEPPVATDVDLSGLAWDSRAGMIRDAKRREQDMLEHGNEFHTVRRPYSPSPQKTDVSPERNLLTDQLFRTIQAAGEELTDRISVLDSRLVRVCRGEDVPEFPDNEELPAGSSQLAVELSKIHTRQRRLLWQVNNILNSLDI